MKFTYNWLRDFVDIKIMPKVLAEKLTMAGLEVVSLEEKNGDFVFEVEVTSNRPDWLSVLGIAQEVAAITNADCRMQNAECRKSKSLSSNNPQSAICNPQSFNIQIQDKKGCAFYRGCLIEGVKVALSPEWLKNRLELVGLRPVNNIVDITNYCLLEYGQPLHAFDYDKFVEGIIVRRAKDKEKILTIDGVERELDENILVISDKDKAVAVAGIIGDKLTEVTNSTKNILLESAYFDPLIVRRASRKLAVSTESSYRFERGVDFEKVILCQNRAVQLICEIAGGKLVVEKEAGSKIKTKPNKIELDCKKVNSFPSANLNLKKIKDILSALGFLSRNLTKDKLLVTVVPARRDIKIEADLIEEIARIYGYDNIASTLPAIRSQQIENSQQDSIKPQIRSILCSLGFNETITHSLLSKNSLNAAAIKKDAIRLSNPLSAEQEYLRPNLRASLINCIAYNLNHKNANLRLFELSHVFQNEAADETTSENINLGLIAIGKLFDHWQIKKDFDFFTLKGNMETLIKRLSFKLIFGDPKFILSKEEDLFFQKPFAKITCQDKEIGVIGQINQQILLNFGVKNPLVVFFAEIYLKDLCQCTKLEKVFKPLCPFPRIYRDLSLIVKEETPYENILRIIKRDAGGCLEKVKLIDTYKGQQIPEGYIGMTISLELGLPDQDLSLEDVAKVMQIIISSLKSELGVEIR